MIIELELDFRPLFTMDNWESEKGGEGPLFQRSVITHQHESMNQSRFEFDPWSNSIVPDDPTDPPVESRESTVETWLDLIGFDSFDVTRIDRFDSDEDLIRTEQLRQEAVVVPSESESDTHTHTAHTHTTEHGWFRFRLAVIGELSGISVVLLCFQIFR